MFHFLYHSDYIIPYRSSIVNSCISVLSLNAKVILDIFRKIKYNIHKFMDVYFADDDLDRLEVEAGFTAGRSPAIVKAFRKRMQMIRAAVDEREFYKWRSLNFERLKGSRKHQWSMRLNDQFRLVVEIGRGSSTKSLRIICIEDYH